MNETSRARKLYGTEEAQVARRVLRAGDLSVEIEGGNLRYIRFGGREVLRGVAFLVRDRDWGTFATTIEAPTIDDGEDTFSMTYRGHCTDGGARLNLVANIEGRADGRLSFRVAMTPTADFTTNRAGFAILHPLDGVAGHPIGVEHTDGTTEDTTLPRLVSPHQPLRDIRAIRHQVAPGIHATVTFEADVAFEMEDQRNWTDASFKTYFRPLDLPFPYTLAARQTTEQAVHITLEAPDAAAIRRQPSTGPQHASITLGPAAASLPVPRVGVGVGAADAAAALEVADAIAGLGLQHLVVAVDPHSNPVDDTLAAAGQLAQRLGAAVVLEAIVPCVQPIATELGELAAAVSRSGVTPQAVTVSPAADLKTGSPHTGALPTLADLYQAARAAFPGIALGGGMFSYFTELNRKRPPVEHLDFVTHTTCPIVHAADDDSVIETLSTLPWIFESTRAFIGDRPYHLGPSSIGMRSNPYGSAPAPNPTGIRVPMARRDPRQQGLFGAAFYLGYAAAAVRARIAALSLCAATGPDGLIATGSGATDLVPAFHIMRALAGAVGKPALPVTAVGAVDGVAWRSGDTTSLLVANLSRETIRVAIEPEPSRGAGPRAAVLDEDSFEAATRDSRFMDRATALGGPLALRAHAVALVTLSAER